MSSRSQAPGLRWRSFQGMPEASISVLGDKSDTQDRPNHSPRIIASISGHRYETLFAIALTTGMRPSEYLALTWTDFDLERGAVSVSKTLEWRTEGWCFEDTKRERSRRMIKLQNWVLALARKIREESKPAGCKPGALARQTWEVRFMSRSLSGGTSNHCSGQLDFRTYVFTICATRQLASLCPQECRQKS
jgi:integrase